ncbi:MAG: MBL fold metallo-hydrolase [Hyphomicrobium sp.]
MFNGLTAERVKSVDWLHPHYALPDGTVRYSVHAYVVESQGHCIIVDTCIGNDKARANEGWNKLQIPFIERLTKAGYPPESITIVLCTHLHLDHVGWNTRWDGEKWMPTFPNAAISSAEASGDTGPTRIADRAICRNSSSNCRSKTRS